MPEIEHWLDSPIVASYPYTRTFDQARYEPFVVVHTSGSTGKNILSFKNIILPSLGLPKVVIVNHGTVAALDAFNEGASKDGHAPMAMDVLRDKHCYISLPFFHVRPPRLDFDLRLQKLSSRRLV